MALSVRGAMGQYLEALILELASEVELHLFIPEHYRGQTGSAVVYYFRTGETRRRAALSFLNPFRAWVLWRRIGAVEPNLIHIFNGEGYPWTLLWAYEAERRRIPILVTIHDPEPHPGNFWELLNAWLRPYVLRRADGVHVHNRSFVNVVRAHGARDIRVIPHGSLARRFLRFREPGVQREPLALFFGRIEPYKGLDTLVEAGITLGGRLRIAIAGPGRLPQKLARRIRQYAGLFELHNRFLHEREVARLFQRAQVCVLPYQQASQSSVPLISAAFGVPVVATAVGGFLEDIPRVNGILIPPGDVSALSNAMLEALGRSPIYPPELEFPTIARQFIEWYKRYMTGK